MQVGGGLARRRRRRRRPWSLKRATASDGCANCGHRSTIAWAIPTLLHSRCGARSTTQQVMCLTDLPSTLHIHCPQDHNPAAHTQDASAHPRYTPHPCQEATVTLAARQTTRAPGISHPPLPPCYLPFSLLPPYESLVRHSLLPWSRWLSRRSSSRDSSILTAISKHRKLPALPPVSFSFRFSIYFFYMFPILTSPHRV